MEKQNTSRHVAGLIAFTQCMRDDIDALVDRQPMDFSPYLNLHTTKVLDFNDPDDAYVCITPIHASAYSTARLAEAVLAHNKCDSENRDFTIVFSIDDAVRVIADCMHFLATEDLASQLPHRNVFAHIIRTTAAYTRATEGIKATDAVYKRFGAAFMAAYALCPTLHRSDAAPHNIRTLCARVDPIFSAEFKDADAVARAFVMPNTRLCWEDIFQHCALRQRPTNADRDLQRAKAMRARTAYALQHQ